MDRNKYSVECKSSGDSEEYVWYGSKNVALLISNVDLGDFWILLPMVGVNHFTCAA